MIERIEDNTFIKFGAIVNVPNKVHQLTFDSDGDKQSVWYALGQVEQDIMFFPVCVPQTKQCLTPVALLIHS